MRPIVYAERLREDVSSETELVALGDAYHRVVEDRSAAYREDLLAFLG